MQVAAANKARSKVLGGFLRDAGRRRLFSALILAAPKLILSQQRQAHVCRDFDFMSFASLARRAVTSHILNDLTHEYPPCDSNDITLKF